MTLVEYLANFPPEDELIIRRDPKRFCLILTHKRTIKETQATGSVTTNVAIGEPSTFLEIVLVNVLQEQLQQLDALS